MRKKIYWDERIETLDPELIKENQLEKLKSLLVYVKKHSPYCRGALASVVVSEVKTLEDMQILPFTEPDSVLKDPFQFRADTVISRIHCSGGTMASPKILFFAPEDLYYIFNLAARKFYMMGIRRNDRIALLQPFDIYLVGFGHLEAHNKIGAEVVPLGVRLEQDFIVNLFEQTHPTVIDSSPSIVMRLTNTMIQQGFDLRSDFSVKRIILAGEKITSSLRNFIEEKWGAEVFNDYGLTEMGIIAAECSEYHGMHIAVDHFIVEVIDLASDKPIKGNETGELILTPLNLRGTPLIRYRTGDIVKISNARCGCGRTHPLVEWIGRKDECLIIESINLYPYQFNQALQRFAPEIVNYQIVYENIGEKDQLQFIAEAKQLADKQEIELKITNALRHVSIDFLEILEKSSIEVTIEIVEPLTIASTSRGKTKCFVDKRKED